MEEEEFQEADVLWPWPDTPPPWPEELYACDDDDATVGGGFSCDPFSDEPAAASLSSASTSSSALLFDRSSSSESEDGSFFLSGRSTTVGSELAALSPSEFLEKDVLWPDTAPDDVVPAEVWCGCRCRRVQEAAAASGKRDGWELLLSSPIDIPGATGAAAAHHRRPSPSTAVPLHLRRRW